MNYYEKTYLHWFPPHLSANCSEEEKKQQQQNRTQPKNQRLQLRHICSGYYFQWVESPHQSNGHRNLKKSLFGASWQGHKTFQLISDSNLKYSGTKSGLEHDKPTVAQEETPGHETPGRVPRLSSLKTNMQWRSEKVCPAPRRTGVPLLSHNTQRPSRCSETWLGLPYTTWVQELGQKEPEKVCMSLQIWSRADKGYKTTNLTSSTSKNDCLWSERLKKQHDQRPVFEIQLSCDHLLLSNAVLNSRAFKCLRNHRKNSTGGTR